MDQYEPHESVETNESFEPTEFFEIEKSKKYVVTREKNKEYVRTYNQKLRDKLKAAEDKLKAYENQTESMELAHLRKNNQHLKLLNKEYEALVSDILTLVDDSLTYLNDSVKPFPSRTLTKNDFHEMFLKIMDEVEIKKRELFELAIPTTTTKKKGN